MIFFRVRCFFINAPHYILKIGKLSLVVKVNSKIISLKIGKVYAESRSHSIKMLK